MGGARMARRGKGVVMHEEPEDDGVIAKVKKAVDSVNPFAVAAKVLTTGEAPKKAAPKTDGLAKGRSSAIFQANVKKLRDQGYSEADATKRAQKHMMEN